MTSGFGRKLLRGLRTRTGSPRVLERPPSDRDHYLPARPTAHELHAAMADIVSRRARNAEEFAGLLLAADRDGDPEVLARTGQLLRQAGPHVWLTLDVAARRVWLRAPRWSSAAVQRLPQGTASPVGLAVAALHPDGRVREAAVAQLAELHDTLAMPVLALRAADWASQVRDRARSALEHRFAEPSPASLVAAAGIVLALRERQEGRWAADRVEALLREGPADLLAAALAAADPRTCRAAHLTALATGRLDLAQMLRGAQHAGDLPTRIRCAEAAVRTAAAAGTVHLVRPLCSSTTAVVRAEAVQALAREGDTAPALACLADRKPIVRAVAQAALRRTGVDPAEHYRRLVKAPLPEPGAIGGLGETGGADDIGLISPWLGHPQARGRAEAVRALRRLGAADPDTLFELLTDPSGAVTREVTLALSPWASDLDLPRLWDLVAERNPWHLRKAGYRLLRERDIWTRLLVDLELAADRSPGLRNRARDDIANWLAGEAATTFTMPQGPVADALAVRLRDVQGALGPDQARLLRFHLGLNRPSKK